MKLEPTSSEDRLVGRNDPCWCGSGKKYKRCHLPEDTAGGTRPTNRERPVLVKTPAQIEGMRRAGLANGELMEYLRPMVKPGVSTGALDTLVHAFTIEHGWVPACLGYQGYPKSCCISVNEVVCHGIPDEKQVLREGDIVNIDMTTIVDGFYGDSSETIILGDVPEPTRALVETAACAMLRGIGAVRAGRPLGDIARAIDPYVRSRGCSVVRQYTGHGIGRQFHEHFSVYHHEESGGDPLVMEPGMTFTIEPMVNMGNYRVTTDVADGWTVRTRDGSLSAQFEHTVLVTTAGVEVLTLTPSQRKAGVLLSGERMDLHT